MKDDKYHIAAHLGDGFWVERLTIGGYWITTAHCESRAEAEAYIARMQEPRK